MSSDYEPFLVLAKYHLSEARARKAVDTALSGVGLDPSTIGPHDVITVHEAKNTSQLSYSDLVRETRLKGVVPYIQSRRDSQDGVFGGNFAMSLPNFQMKSKTEWCGWTKEWRGPGRSCPAIWDLTDDIFYYREQVCRHSIEHGLDMSARYYRAYLSACVSIVEAFINRYVYVAAHDGFTSPAFETLKRSTNLNERVALWLQCFCADPNHGLYDRPEWSKFTELRGQRNHLIHAIDPISIYQVREMQQFLNYVNDGVGGLLQVLREMRSESAPGFVLRLLTAPHVTYRRIRFKADGKHVIPEHG